MYTVFSTIAMAVALVQECNKGMCPIVNENGALFHGFLLKFCANVLEYAA